MRWRKFVVGVAVGVVYAVCVAAGYAGPLPDGLPEMFDVTDGTYGGSVEWSDIADTYTFVPGSGIGGVDGGEVMSSVDDASGQFTVGGSAVLSFNVLFPGDGSVVSASEGVTATVPEAGVAGVAAGFFLFWPMRRCRRSASTSRRS